MSKGPASRLPAHGTREIRGSVWFQEQPRRAASGQPASFAGKLAGFGTNVHSGALTSKLEDTTQLPGL